MKPTIKLDKLIRLLEKNGFHTKWEQGDDFVTLGSKQFHLSKSPQEFMELPSNQGLLLERSSKELRKSLQDSNINYIDLEGHLHINLNSTEKLIIEESTSKKIKPGKRVALDNLISPTLLVSPNGFALIDTLFRISAEELEKYSSTLQFCKRHNLYQPKVSKVMTGLRVKNLISLKQALIDLPIDWWLYAFDTPATKRKMTTFFEVSHNYYSLDQKNEQLSEDEIFKKIDESFQGNVTEGPTFTAKKFGELVDADIALWISPAVLSKFKKEFKLVAGSKDGHRRWLLASPPLALDEAELLTHELDKSKLGAKTNIMRSIWDLSYSESRLREIRGSMLRSFIK